MEKAMRGLDTGDEEFFEKKLSKAEKKELAKKKREAKKAAKAAKEAAAGGGAEADDGAAAAGGKPKKLAPSALRAAQKAQEAKDAIMPEGWRDLAVTGSLASDPKLRDVHIENFSLGFHGQQLVKDTRFELNYGRRYGLLGENGSGKSSLLCALSQQEVEIPEHIDIFHLICEAEASKTITALQYVSECTEARATLEKEAEVLTDLLGDETEDGVADMACAGLSPTSATAPPVTCVSTTVAFLPVSAPPKTATAYDAAPFSRIVYTYPCGAALLFARVTSALVTVVSAASAFRTTDTAGPPPVPAKPGCVLRGPTCSVKLPPMSLPVAAVVTVSTRSDANQYPPARDSAFPPSMPSRSSPSAICVRIATDEMARKSSHCDGCIAAQRGAGASRWGPGRRAIDRPNGVALSDGQMWCCG